MADIYEIAAEVKEALAEGRAVVALESTLVAQGLPWPANLETAQGAEAAVRAAGATPATIAVVAGRIRVGLSALELEHLARAGTFLKAGRRDLSQAVARRLDAATTVSATLWIARGQGIGVMATGGLGGVHREAATTFDVSNDLDELARADGALVVCSGIKSILDMPATLDALETRGVPVVGYQTSELPAFLTRSSGLALEARVESADEAAALVHAHRALRLPAAVILTQPVPEADALDAGAMDDALASALAEARHQRISGKAVTPFLLDRIRQATEGRGLRANQALILANARLAGDVAVALAASEDFHHGKHGQHGTKSK
ncbi:pseudouridine-5'-phosphate glycosidase [Singulisphaera acidiphila]|uniref:Pseudouridine-5'-phosphate glycosidase n=3 Tax=Singulisphaera acidiphila TaxID=466153 RepID=L0D6W6_SINAD|nr:pseudouridine-5'-phosphate glycosidase [Singulisphaera acidiphila]AGA24977.1 putative enzyme involved in pigment biosynthesis [Singulisphaera acidiphila DSM 18658]